MVIMGALAHLVNMPHEYLEEFVEQRFSRGREGDDEIIRSNIQALRLGREHIAISGLNLGELAPSQMPEYQQLMIKGNEALSLGAIAGGLEFYVGYPISPRHADPALYGTQPHRQGQVRLPSELGDRVNNRASGRGVRRETGDDRHRRDRVSR